MPSETILTLDQVQWALVGGYVPLTGAMAHLYLELLKSKTNEVTTLKEIIPLVNKLTELNEKLRWLIESRGK